MIRKQALSDYSLSGMLSGSGMRKVPAKMIPARGDMRCLISKPV
ncbi:Uncharacterized protein dnm_091030 [Desulfonema magnum]|uniref:Uncharacterized protein n=1 Tax=Desulfonema magnum TaxID=45655 RepID=A0A975BXJ1_9BACT|nr:Uncharacterized protein dnm_091030 [Desulfonema magnum]